MPTVTRYGQQKVDTAPLPGVRRTAAETPLSEGANVDEARAQTGETIAGAIGAPLAREGAAAFAEMQQQARRDADETAVLKAKNALSAWKATALFDPASGAFAQKGEKAFPLPEQIQGQFTDVTGTIEKDLKTPEQRLAFEKVKAEEWPTIDLSVRRHVAAEMQDFRAGELKSFVGNTVDDAIRNAQDPRLVGQSLQKAVDAIRTNAPRLGQGPEAVDAQVRAVQSSVHVGVISQLLASEQDANAREYFNATKDQIHADRLDEITKALDVGTLRRQAQQQSDGIIRAGGTLTEQREKARAIEEPKLRDEVMQRIEHEATISDHAAREQEAHTLRGVYNILDQTHDVTKIPPAVWAGMDGSARSAARGYAEHLAKGIAVETDFPTYYALMQKAANEPEAFASDNLLKYRASIGDTELKQLTTMQGAIVKGEHAKAEAAGLAGFRTNDQILTDSLHQYGITASGKDQTADERNAIAELRRRLDRDLAAQEALTGKKPTNLDRQSALDKILSVSKTTPGSWWGLNPFSSTPLHDKTTRVIDIPLADRQQIEAKLRAKGRPVDDATVLAVYVAAQK